MESHETLRAAIDAALTSTPEGLSEYELLRVLSGDPELELIGEVFASDFSLFQTHFVLFHALYLWRDELRESAAGDLEIHCLKIKRLPHTSPNGALAHPDPLRDYYSDLSNLNDTNAEDVQAMLDRFWKLYVRNDRRQDALSVLDLPPDATDVQVKRAYHALALAHHPDRGGDASCLKEINAAMALLKG